MTTFKRAILIACVPWLLGACSKADEQDTRPSAETPTAIHIQVAPKSSLDSLSLDSRTFLDTTYQESWVDGDTIGLFAIMHKKGKTGTVQASGNFMDNVKLTYHKTSNSWTLPSTYYFPAQENMQLSLFAYYPYDPKCSNPLNMSYQVVTDQRDSSEFAAANFMIAFRSQINRNDVIQLKMHHATKLIEVDLSESSANTPVYVADKLKVIVHSQNKSMQIQLSSDSYQIARPREKADILMHRVALHDSARWVYRAYVTSMYNGVNTAEKIFSFQQDIDGNGLYTDGNEFSLSYTNLPQHPYMFEEVHPYKIKLVDLARPDPNHIYAVGDYYPHVGRVVGIVYEVSNGGLNGKLVSLSQQFSLWDEASQWANSQTAGELHWTLPTWDELKAIYKAWNGTLSGTGSTQAEQDARAAFNAKLTALGNPIISTYYYWTVEADPYNPTIYQVCYFGAPFVTVYSNRSSHCRAVTTF